MTPRQPLFASAALSGQGRQRAARFAGRVAGLLLVELFLLSGAAIQPLLASPAVSQGTREETNPKPREAIDQDVREATAQLKRVWQRDPVIAGRPFPDVRLLDRITAQTCPGAPFPASQPLLLACPGQGQILLDRRALAGPRQYFGAGNGAVTFLVAYGLGQGLVAPFPPTAPLPAATRGLQAACLAGTLLGAITSGDRKSETPRLDAAIRTAAQSFPASAAGQLGTGPQRAYAVLSGLGATALDCEPAAMARLAAGQVQVDPDLGSRGPGSLGLDVACRKPPAPACPRPLPSSVGVGGV
jgi:hypothetical protein